MKILNNNTVSNILISDTGITILAGGSYTIPPQDYLLWAASSNVITYIGNGSITVTDGTYNLSISEGTDLIKGLFPKQIGITAGTDNTPIGHVGDSLKTTATFAGEVTVKSSDNMEIDSFGRQRISLPETVFNSLFILSKEDTKWSEGVYTSGTSTHNSVESVVDMAVTTTAGSKVIRQTRQSITYIPGCSKLVKQSFVFNTPKSGLRQRIGSFGVNNGVYFETNSLDLKIVLRSSSSGSIVNNEILQANWNVDKLDGTGNSGKTLDASKAQILFIDLQWLGVGRVRVGFVIDGKYIIAHEFLHSNNISTTYMQQAKLHLRVEIENLTATATASTLKHICSSVSIEGSGKDLFGTHRTANCGVNTISIGNGATKCVMALRPSASYNGVTVIPKNINILPVQNANLFYQIIFNGTINGGTWNYSSDYTQYNNSATSFSGGIVISSGYISAGENVANFSSDLENTIFLGHDINDIPDTVAIVITSISGNASLLIAIDYSEIY